jgi:hypothetical protein
MTRPTRTTAALGLALLAAAVPAAARAAAPPHVPVPPGQLQHTVTEISFPAAKNTFHHDALRNERWITATAGRELVTDVSTGKVREDCQYRLKVVRCWAGPLTPKEPAAGVTHIIPGSAVLLQSWIDLGANVKSLLGDPRGYHQTGTTTYLGRPAVTLVQPAQRGPDGGIESTSVIAEADNFYPLRNEVLDADQPYLTAHGHKGKEQVDQLTQTKTMEVVSPAGVKLTIAAHPHAKVVDDRPAARAARKRAAAKKAHGKPARKQPASAGRAAAAR